MTRNAHRTQTHPLQRSNSQRPGAVAAAVAVAVAALLLAPAATAHEGKGKPSGPAARLELVDANPGVIAIHPASGWQLSALLHVKNGHLLGIGAANYPPVFPGSDRTAFIVFTDPDGCPSFIELGPQVDTYADFYCSGEPSSLYPDCEPVYWPDDEAWPGIALCPPGDFTERQGWIADLSDAGLAWPKDETWVEITPGISVPDEVPTVSQVGFDEEEPVLWVGAAGAWQRWSYGPDLGSTEDDFRYGHWRRLPGLVVLADHGPGVRTVAPGDSDTEPAADFFDRPRPAEAWNLAGFFSSAAYSLKGGVNATSVLAHLNVPRGLFTPVVLVDKEISLPKVDDHGTLCGEGESLYRMDGGPLTCYPGNLAMTDPLLNQTVVTVRVFAVDGEAPDVLVDRDWDGDVDIQDARLMGLKPVTSQVLTRFRQYHEIECSFVHDFDGDGDPGGCVAPARPGGLTRPPR